MTEYKLIVAGSRSFNDYQLLSETLFSLASQTTDAVSIVSGMARGADALGHRFAKEHHVKVYEFPAKWDSFGKKAGYIRNTEMGKFADGLLAFWDGQSRGTEHMINIMEQLGKPVHIIRY